ncbi:hypothetical protein JTE90_009514 [Oedothorax gibbosus]|uniref:Uncharacterized protein n=1 Tax=Oedothorax gibbosus TaxID=931172 RepID=A0AAV6UUE4_9ARAC|nr:hypothetical protein JTE90_009514 [Oedothorax gibbosus]
MPLKSDSDRVIEACPDTGASNYFERLVPHPRRLRAALQASNPDIMPLKGVSDLVIGACHDTDDAAGVAIVFSRWLDLEKKMVDASDSSARKVIQDH